LKIHAWLVRFQPHPLVARFLRAVISSINSYILVFSGARTRSQPGCRSASVIPADSSRPRAGWRCGRARASAASPARARSPICGQIRFGLDRTALRWSEIQAQGRAPVLQTGPDGFESHAPDPCSDALLRWRNWKTRRPQKAVSSWREGSTPSLSTISKESMCAVVAEWHTR
jgi:hypothetical protein